MELKVDARGDACPIPVVKTKQALGTIDEGVVEVLVDNETAVHNLENLAKSQNCEFASEQQADDLFVVKVTKTADSAAAEVAPAGQTGKRVVVLSGEHMGQGDDVLGGNLMKAFVFALTQQDALPDTVLLYNGGAHLSCEGSPALDDLKALAQAGTEILTCGTCLKHYGIEDKLAVGEVTNMYVIVQKQLEAGVVVRP
ncbi:MAG: sulfurtransferase-like selenium metabolism protein YedF [Eggerthellaceae bacterium]|nr:sulfurtransferase-like selenium metabolism protein YedF [Eggerthellaceae bacterium]